MILAQTTERPHVASPRLAETPTAGALVPYFDLDAFHAMEKRDETLIRDEIMGGSGSSAFVYNFDIQGKQVAGVSVVGARHLAAKYGGLRHRLVASIDKHGAVFTFTSYPSENQEMRVSVSVVSELEHEDDYYEALIEITDVKTGNTVQMQRRESRFEKRRDGSFYERPNYPVIASSKAYRNAILTLIPQDFVIEWKIEMLKLKKNDLITGSVIDEKRSAVLRFAAAKAIPLSREKVEQLTLDQITGLGDAARDENAAAFAQAAQALGLVPGAETAVAEVAQTGSATATISEDKPAEGGGEQTGDVADQKPADTKKAAATTKPKDEKPKEADQAKPAAAGREPRFEV